MARKSLSGPKGGKSVESLGHPDAARLNAPTAEQQSFVAAEEAAPRPIRYPRNTALDPQLVWRGKDEQDGEDLIVPAVPIYIQEKIHPEALIADLRRRSDAAREADSATPDLFADAYPALSPEAAYEFYAHEERWANRMILGDSLLVMTSLAEKEALRGRVQCIYIDPPYGIKFNSNWQPSTRSRDVKDGKRESLTREPEMVRAFRDTWKDGVHSYLSYLRDRLTVARDLLTESGSCFVQIGDENVHLVRALMDEVFGRENFVGQILFKKTGGLTEIFLSSVGDYIIWYAKNRSSSKYNQIYKSKKPGEPGATQFRYQHLDDGSLKEISFEDANKIPSNDVAYHDNITSQGNTPYDFEFRGNVFRRGYKPSPNNLDRISRSGRFIIIGNTPRYIRKLSDFSVYSINELWDDLSISGFSDQKIYVVQTATSAVERCILMTTDPGDLVLDPTCGSGTTAHVAEQWGRRWITIDTSRVALALARQRLMAGRFNAWLLQDTPEGALKEGEIAGRPPTPDRLAELSRPNRKPAVREGFVLHRVPHVTLKSIANNAEIDAIWEQHQPAVLAALAALNDAHDQAWQEWEVPRELPDGDPALLAAFWQARRARQAEIDASIARNADTEYLVDKPYEAKGRVRVCGPFTVESLSPHRVLSTETEEDAALVAQLAEAEGRKPPQRTRSLTRAEADARAQTDFVRVVLENLRASGVQNTKKGERLDFTELKPWPGSGLIAAEGRYAEGEVERRAAIVIGPEYGAVGWRLVRDAAREAVDLFDALIICGFAFEPQVNEESFTRLGRLTVLKANMNNDLHMAGALKPTGAGNLFVVFGEPDVKIRPRPDGLLEAEIIGLDVFDPTTGEVRSSDLNDIACWFLDDDYDGDSFFVRHAYFLGGNDPYAKLKTTLRAEIDAEAWDALYAATSRPFAAPRSGRVAVKVINHYGDEVMKVFQQGRDW